MIWFVLIFYQFNDYEKRRNQTNKMLYNLPWPLEAPLSRGWEAVAGRSLWLFMCIQSGLCQAGIFTMLLAVSGEYQWESRDAAGI